MWSYQKNLVLESPIVPKLIFFKTNPNQIKSKIRKKEKEKKKGVGECGRVGRDQALKECQ